MPAKHRGSEVRGWYGQSQRFWTLPITECLLLPKQTCELASKTSAPLTLQRSGRKFFFFSMFSPERTLEPLVTRAKLYGVRAFQRPRDTTVPVAGDGGFDGRVKAAQSPDASATRPSTFLFFLKLHLFAQKTRKHLSGRILLLVQSLYNSGRKRKLYGVRASLGEEASHCASGDTLKQSRNLNPI
jgi:hypothetical protein